MTEAAGGFKAEQVVVQSHNIGLLNQERCGDLRGGFRRGGDRRRTGELRTTRRSVRRDRYVFMGEDGISGYTAKVIRPE